MHIGPFILGECPHDAVDPLLKTALASVNTSLHGEHGGVAWLNARRKRPTVVFDNGSTRHHDGIDREPRNLPNRHQSSRVGERSWRN